MVTIYLTLILIFFFGLLNNFFLKKISKSSLFFFSYKQFFISQVIVFFFFFGFFFSFRILNIFLSSRKNINLNLELEKISILLVTYNTIIIIMIFLLLIFCRNLIFLVVRKNFLKLHYYLFMQYRIYNSVFFFLKNIRYTIFNSLGFKNKKLYIIIIFCLKYFFKAIFLFFFFKAIFFDNFIMYIGFIPYYTLYYFIFNFIKFLEFFESDFDDGMIKIYYPEFFGITDLGLLKLNLYSQKLILGYSDFCFVNSIIFKINFKYPSNWIFFEFDYSRNKTSFNDILKINKKISPKLLIE